MESQNAFSNKLYSGGDVVVRGDQLSQLSDDSVYEVKMMTGFTFHDLYFLVFIYLCRIQIHLKTLSPKGLNQQDNQTSIHQS